MIFPMLSPSEVTTITDAVVRFIETNGVRFERGDPRKFFSHFSHVNERLTLPIVAREHLSTVVLLKNFYALWNFVVDDEIDREGRSNHLDASIQVLLRGEPGAAQDSSAARVLANILDGLPTDLAKAHLREMFRFDLWTLVCGFKYEFCINKMTAAANSLEYRKYTTMVGTIEQLLDLDCLFAAGELAPSTYRRLRVGYEHFGQALKLASDVGSLKRELMEEDNLNLIRIKGLEAKIPGLERKLTGEEEFEALRPQLQPLVEDVRQEASTHLETGRTVLAGITDVDTQGVVQTVSGIVQNYFERDLFFSK
jgi:hypothetical protein